MFVSLLAMVSEGAGVDSPVAATLDGATAGGGGAVKGEEEERCDGRFQGFL